MAHHAPWEVEIKITRQIAFASLLLIASAGSLAIAKGQVTNTRLSAGKLHTARSGGSPLPIVELNFTTQRAGNWNGKRFRDIIPPKTIQRIIRIRESGFPELTHKGLDANEATTQAGYDSFLAHLFASTEKAKVWGLRAEEHTLAELMVLTTDGQLFHIEIVKGMIGENSCAILIYGQNKGARIEVSNFQSKESRQGNPRPPPAIAPTSARPVPAQASLSN